jgi:hypothetical protein
VIAYNKIGTNAAGTAGLSNVIGILVGRAGDVIIEYNHISANTAGVALGEGFEIAEGEASPGDVIFTENVAIRGNLIGPDLTGNGLIHTGRATTGVLLGKNAVNNRIGGSIRAGYGNTISGHTLGDALFIGTFSENPSVNEIPSGNVIQGNRIGSQAMADGCLPNKTGIRWLTRETT